MRICEVGLWEVGRLMKDDYLPTKYDTSTIEPSILLYRDRISINVLMAATATADNLHILQLHSTSRNRPLCISLPSEACVIQPASRPRWLAFCDVFSKTLMITKGGRLLELHSADRMDA